MRGGWRAVKLGKRRRTRRDRSRSRKLTDLPLRGGPRRLNDELDQVTHGCSNPFPSSADRQEGGGAMRARGEFGLQIPQPTGRPGPCAAATSSLTSLATPPPTHTHTIGAREGATGQARGSGSGIVMHESPAPPRSCQSAPRSRSRATPQPGAPCPDHPPPLALARPSPFGQLCREGAAGGLGLSLPAGGWPGAR